MDSAAQSVDKLESELKSADGAASKFDAGLGKVNDGLGTSTDKFRSTADLAGGLGDVMGISALGPISAYATGMADIADGLGGLLAPALAKSKAAFLAMNTTLMANPIFLVVAALVALTAAFVIAYKKSETFRAIVDGALSWVRDAAKKTLDYISGAVKGAAETLGRIADIITTPYQIAFRAIASLWNNTVGRLSFSVPGWVPGLGGKGFDVPDIPMLADGGVARAGRAHIVGERGPELFVPRMTGTVLPNGAGGGVVTIRLEGTEDGFKRWFREMTRVEGGDVQVVWGR